MLQGLFSDLPYATTMGISPEFAVALAVGVPLAAIITMAFFVYRSASGSFNWQMGLLMSTGVALSIASGWTTWDGMNNFTREPLLAFLITFGIQSVLLVVSWLIGESFANRPRITIDVETSGESAEKGFLWSVTSYTGVAAGFLALVLIFSNWLQLGILEFLDANSQHTLLNVSVGALAISLIVALFLTSGDNLFHRGIGALRVAAQNITLWVMLLACLGASVFFSFDSLFSTIFPQDERARASDIRTRGQIAEVINDVKTRALSRQSEFQLAFSRGQQWANYAKHLDAMVAEAERLPKLLEADASKRFRQVQTNIGALEVDLATAQAQLQSLTARGQGLHEEADRVRASAEENAASRRETREKIATLEQKIAANAVEAEKELNGLGPSATAGRGPIYRSLLLSQKKLEFELKLANQQLPLLEQQAAESQTRLTESQDAAAKADQEIAQQTVTVATARKLLERATRQPDARMDAASSKLVAEQLGQLDAARNEVLRSPSTAAINRVEEACDTLSRTFSHAPGLEEKDWQSGCRANGLRAAAAQGTQISLALAAFEADCSADGKLPDSTGTGELIGFARRCIETSGLSSGEIAAFNNKVGSIDLNRDDKAHRFVVTMNAFGDGNRLAYLALAIALAIDGLVFASGLFYAQAARSPLSDIPGTDGRAQHELEHVLDSALQPNAPDSAAAALENIRPLLDRKFGNTPPGFTHEIDMSAIAPPARSTISKLLAAAAAIGAVRHCQDEANRYLMRGEVVTYLSRHGYKSKGEPLGYGGAAALSELLERILGDDVRSSAATVLRYFQPIPRQSNYATRVILSEVADESDAELVRKVLNAAAVHGYIRHGNEETASPDYLLHRDVFFTLADFASRPTRHSATDPSAMGEATGSIEEQTKDNSIAPSELAASPRPAANDIKDAVRPLAVQDAPEQIGTAAGTLEQMGSSSTTKSDRGVSGAELRASAVKVSAFDVSALDRTHSDSPEGMRAASDPGQPSKTQSDDKSIERPTSPSSPAGLEAAVAVQDDRPDPLDFGIDLSDPAFPENLFENLEDGPVEPKNDTEEEDRKSKVSMNHFSRIRF